jgi:GT2 family glycosyltransferase
MTLDSHHIARHLPVPDVSVIIVSYNTRALTLDCLRSVYEQTRELSFEVFVVDNASSDGSAAAIAAEFPQVHLVANSDNRGFAAANNQAMRLARGRYLCLANSDTVLQGGSVERLCEYLDHHPAVGMVGPRLLWPDRTLQLSCRRFPSLWNNLCPALGLTRLFPRTAAFSGEHMGYFAHDETREVPALVGAFMVIRRSALESVGTMDERFFFYCEEIDWCRRFWDAGWPVVFHSEASVIHIGRGSSCREPERFTREQLVSNCMYWMKHHGILRARAFLMIMLLRHMLRAAVNALPFRMRGACMRASPVLTQPRLCGACVRLLLDPTVTERVRAVSALTAGPA